ncbi:MAG: ATP-binding cassette domain-containing protein [Gemmatimonadota bacterium]|nr:ATP-binding cassette domain-containing protein [Gemmatimonadota bacterium]
MPPGSDADTAAVEFDRASFAVHRGPTIVRELDFDVASGETVVLVGRSGAGKTTALKLVNGLLAPTAGAVRVDGVETTAWDPVELRRGIGWVIQEVGLFPHMTVRRNVGLVPELLGWDEERIAERVDDLLDRVGMPAGRFGARLPHQLSGGQRQRVGVARALGADPSLLLLDEPFGALDALTRDRLQREFGELMEELGKAALFVTHDLREALALGDRVGVLVDGELAVIAEADVLLESDHPEARALAATLQPPGELGGG